MTQQPSAGDPGRTYIIYACPTGVLAEQIAGYMAASRAACGPNAAHAYMPHCTLTGFFHDDAPAIGVYVAALAQALQRARPTQPQPPLDIVGLELNAGGFHGLLLEGSWLKALVADAARNAHSPTRRDALRLKDWLHLSLAYGFAPAQHEALAGLARERVDLRSPVAWELRFYERQAAGGWHCHASWPLNQ